METAIKFKPIFRLVLRNVARLIIHIDIFIIIGILSAFILSLLGHFLVTKTLLTALVLLIVFIVLLPVGYWLLVFLENRFPRLEEIPVDINGIIVLGSGFDFLVTMARKVTSYNMHIGRLIAFTEIAKKYPHCRLAFTGGGRIKNFRKESALAKELFDQMGLDTDKIEFETKASNTNENAQFSYELFEPKTNEKWLLITSALHMPRAVGLFRKLNWQIIPYPVDYHTTGEFRLLSASLFFSLFAWRYSVHECTEMLINFILKESNEFIPSVETTSKV